MEPMLHCFITDTVSFLFHAGGRMLKARERILQTGFECVNAASMREL
jgi:hypothetical protein